MKIPYRKASLLCTACFWGILALSFLWYGAIPFPWLAVAVLGYYLAGFLLALRAISVFKREWLRLFPDQITRYDDVRWGNAKDNFMPGTFQVRKGLQQMCAEMLASPDRTEETEQIVWNAQHAARTAVLHFIVLIGTLLFCFFADVPIPG